MPEIGAGTNLPFYEIEEPFEEDEYTLQYEYALLRKAVTMVETGSYSIKTEPVSYTHLRAHETSLHLVCRLLLEKKALVLVLCTRAPDV